MTDREALGLWAMTLATAFLHLRGERDSLSDAVCKCVAIQDRMADVLREQLELNRALTARVAELESRQVATTHDAM